MPDPRTTTILNVPGARIHAVTASSDGALFVGLAGGIYRLVPAESAEWEKVAETQFVPTDFYAPSRNAVFILGQMSGDVYRWDAGTGVRAMHTPLSDSIIGDGHAQGKVALLDIWGTGADDVYAVGRNAAVMHFDGHEWVLEPNPLVQHAFESSVATLRSVGGNQRSIYAAGTFDLISKGPQGWRVVAPPAGGVPPGWNIAAPLGKSMLFVGRERREQVIRAFNYERGVWRDLSPAVRRVRGDIGDGAPQDEGSVLFWTYLAELVHVRPSRAVTIYPNLSLSLIRGAAIVENDLYVAGTRRNNAVVLRVE